MDNTVWKNPEKVLPEENRANVEVMLGNFSTCECTFDRRKDEPGGGFHDFSEPGLDLHWLTYGKCSYTSINPSKAIILAWRYPEEEEEVEEKEKDINWINPDNERPTVPDVRVEVLLSDMTTDTAIWAVCNTKKTDVGAFHRFEKVEHLSFWIVYGEANCFRQVGHLKVLGWRYLHRS